MKANITRGRSFKPLVEYVADVGAGSTGRKRAEYIGGTVDNGTVEQIVRQLLIPQAIRKVDKPVYHISLSLPPGERLQPDEWMTVAADFLRMMGIPDDTPWLAFRHNDKRHEHIHICMSRVSLSGQVFLGQFEMVKAIQVTQQLEEKYGLTPTKGLAKDRQRLSRSERKMIERTQKLSDKQTVKVHVDKALRRSGSMEEFIFNLEDCGIAVKFNTSKSTGRVSGVSFKKGDFTVKGSQLGSKYSYASLARKLPSVDSVTIAPVREKESSLRRTRAR